MVIESNVLNISQTNILEIKRFHFGKWQRNILEQDKNDCIYTIAALIVESKRGRPHDLEVTL